MTEVAKEEPTGNPTAWETSSLPVSFSGELKQ